MCWSLALFINHVLSVCYFLFRVCELWHSHGCPGCHHLHEWFPDWHEASEGAAEATQEWQQALLNYLALASPSSAYSGKLPCCSPRVPTKNQEFLCFKPWQTTSRSSCDCWNALPVWRLLAIVVKCFIQIKFKPPRNLSVPSWKAVTWISSQVWIWSWSFILSLDRIKEQFALLATKDLVVRLLVLGFMCLQILSGGVGEAISVLTLKREVNNWKV